MILKRYTSYTLFLLLFICCSTQAHNNNPADIHAFWGVDIAAKALVFRAQLLPSEQALFDAIPEKFIAITTATQQFPPLIAIIDEIKTIVVAKSTQYASIFPLIKKFLAQSSNIVVTINPETMTIALMSEVGEEIAAEDIARFAKTLSKKNKLIVQKLLADIAALNKLYQPRIESIMQALVSVAEKMFNTDDERIFEQFKAFLQE
jgi:archaellum biogenesis ATPase FlaH